jgi:hypothetical protein
MPSRSRRSEYIPLDDSIVRWSSREIRCPKMMLPAYSAEHGLPACLRAERGSWPKGFRLVTSYSTISYKAHARNRRA